jgi:tetratricopeptide (TPR) repeat protein
MQLASDLDFEGHKLMLDGIGGAKAEMLVRLLDGATALVLLDNFTNDVEAFNIFRRAKGVTVVAADRDYHLSSNIHRLALRSVAVVDITELTDPDLQDLRDSIPTELRRSAFVRPETSMGVQPSIFEFIQANVVGPTLRVRFEAALRDLRKSEPDLADMLLLASYVHSCRTPLSMDMALGYWGAQIASYESVYELIKRAGAILNEYEGDLAKDDQDYFAARSVLAAESVLAAASGSDLRSMLLHFYDNISQIRIVGYHIFKRRAFDASLFAKAFHVTDEAVALYDELYARDPSAYTLQQKAIFLSGRKEYAAAFKAIDRAMATARKSNWTIRNSYAQILFRANVEFAARDPEVRELLDRAMAILTQCYRSDRRRSGHALVYGDFALRYGRIFADDRAREYLAQADVWLGEVITSEPWIRRAPRIQLSVRRAQRDLT